VAEKTPDEHFDASRRVRIGLGAYRLAEAGLDVCLLSRAAYPPGSFADSPR
jgi:hypothetical protein